MESFLLKNDNELLESLGVQNDEVKKHKPTTTRKFYYESYVRKVLGDNQKHFEELMKEYKAFYDEYQETKKFPEMPSIVNNLTTVKEEVPPPQTQPEANKPEEEKQKNEEAKEDEENAEEGEDKNATGNNGEEEKLEEPKVETVEFNEFFDNIQRKLKDAIKDNEILEEIDTSNILNIRELEHELQGCKEKISNELNNKIIKNSTPNGGNYVVYEDFVKLMLNKS